MIIIKDDVLVHTDNAGDVIEHFGIKDMKWGVRSRHKELKDLSRQHRTIKRNVSNAVKMYGRLMDPGYKQYLKNTVKASKESNKLFEYEALKKESKNSKRAAKWDKKLKKHQKKYDKILKKNSDYMTGVGG